MHESGLVRDLMRRVEVETVAGERVRSLSLRVGVLSGVSPETLRQGLAVYALEVWGYSPAIQVEQSTDPRDPNGTGVVLVSIGFGD